MSHYHHRRLLIYVRDLPAAVAYYRDVLGFTPGQGWEDRNQEFAVDGGPPLVLHAGGVANREPRSLTGLVPSFQVADLQAVVQRLEERGVVPIRPIQEVAHGSIYFFADLEGNPFQLYQPGPDAEAG